MAVHAAGVPRALDAVASSRFRVPKQGPDMLLFSAAHTRPGPPRTSIVAFAIGSNFCPDARLEGPSSSRPCKTDSLDATASRRLDRPARAGSRRVMTHAEGRAVAIR